MLTEVDDKKIIAITPEWLKEKFDEMNELLFNGKLKPCPLRLFTTGRGSQGNTLGRFMFTRNLKWDPYKTYGGKHPLYVTNYWGDKIWLDEENFNTYAKPEIILNGNYNWTEKAALSTLVHEMCHYYDYKDGWAPIQGHGPSFRNIAQMVSRKSNEFFTVERLAKAEQMTQMDFTDDMKAFNNRRAANGIHVIKMEFNKPREGKSGNMWSFAYMIPARTKYNEYIEWVRDNVGEGKLLKCACDCLTTDGTVKRYKVSKSPCILWRYKGSWDEITPDVKFDKETWIGNPNATNQPQQPEKRYSFTINTMKNGVPDVFIIRDATEQEAKQKMRERFPGWSDAIIDDKFRKYTQTQAMVGENKITRNELQQIVEQVIEQLVQEQRALPGT